MKRSTGSDWVVCGTLSIVGSTNTERGAVATWSVTVTNEFIVTRPGRYRSWFCICLALRLASC
ncbi:MAG TPA: hypothetical protein VGJ48_00520 [Pyrinomonadaceae bacterium]